MFEHARLKLTAWYLLIIMAISFIFSVIIYNRADIEFKRVELIHQGIEQNFRRQIPPPHLPGAPAPITISPDDQDVIKHARERFILSLGVINLIILIGAGGSGYFLAGRTLKPIREMLDEQNRFITDSSHELRTPLTSLRSEIEVALRNKSLSTEDARKILRSNLEEVIILQALSDDLLELAQNGSSMKNSQKEKVSVQAIVQNAIKRVGPSAQKKQIKIENKVKDIKVLGIEDRLAEAFIILLDNAIKYSPKGSKVSISSEVSDRHVRIYVIDNGMGIREQDLPHIFDRFYRGDKSRTESGYGLGLSIAKKIVESHEGTIKVLSQPFKQTKFTVSLPI